MSRTRTRWRLSLTATALLAAFLVLAPVRPPRTTAEDTTDYTITVDPTATGATIDDTMYGVFFEDINRAADGGLYAELVQNRSFEYTTADNALLHAADLVGEPAGTAPRSWTTTAG